MQEQPAKRDVVVVSEDDDEDLNNDDCDDQQIRVYKPEALISLIQRTDTVSGRQTPVAHGVLIDNEPDTDALPDCIRGPHRKPELWKHIFIDSVCRGFSQKWAFDVRLSLLLLVFLCVLSGVFRHDELLVSCAER